MNLLKKIALLSLLPCLMSFLYARDSAPTYGYMHNSRDNGERVKMKNLSGAVVELNQNFISESNFFNPGQRANVENVVLQIPGGEKCLIPVSLVDKDVLRMAQSRTLRIHVWIKGEDTGRGMGLWEGCPGVSLILKDDTDNHVVEVSGLFHTRGTFPWFCYYVDVPVPVMNLESGEKLPEAQSEAAASDGQANDKGEDAITGPDYDLNYLDDDAMANSADKDGLPHGAGLYICLSNPASGMAYFADISYEFLSYEANIPTNSKSGSKAPNPQFDELPMHIFFGLDDINQRRWNFLEGNETMPSLLTNAGLTTYLSTAENDWFSMMYGVSMLLSMKNDIVAAGKLASAKENGKTAKSSMNFAFEPGWDKTLGEFLFKSQDENTGLWRSNGEPDIMTSWAIVSRLLSPSGFYRTDEMPFATPFHSVNGQAMQYPEQVANTLLQCRIGNAETGYYWNQYCLNSNSELGLENRQTLCHLGTTSSAVCLLRVAADMLDFNPELQKAAYDAIDSATRYVLLHMVRQDGAILQSSNSNNDISPVFFLDLIEASQMLEPRKNQKLSAPQITGAANLEKTKLELQVGKFAPGQTSIRIFMADEDTEAADIGMQNLIAVIKGNGKRQANQDELLLLANSVDYMQSSCENFYKDQIKNYSYINEKLGKISGWPQLQMVYYGKGRVAVKLPQKGHKSFAEDEDEEEAGKVYYAMAVDGFGRCSEMVPILQAQTADDSDEDEDE